MLEGLGLGFITTKPLSLTVNLTVFVDPTDGQGFHGSFRSDVSLRIDGSVGNAT
jgi:hypothetical protein